MSDSDEDYSSPSPKMSEYPTYEIDCNLETLMAIKPPLSVLLHPPEYTDTQFIIEGNESPVRSMETDFTAPGTEIPFQIYSRPLDEDVEEEFTDTGGLRIVSARTEESETFAEYGDYSEDNISDNSLDDLLDTPPNFREGYGHRLPDILDNLAGVQGGSTCRCVSDYLAVTADKILICSPDGKQNRSTSNNQIIEKKEDNKNEEEEEDERLQEEEDDYNITDNSNNSTDSKEGSQNELTFGEYSFSGLDFQIKDLLTKEHRRKYPIRSSVSNIPQGTKHLELTKEERQMMIDEMLLLRKDTIKGNRRHSWTGNLKLGKSFFLSPLPHYKPQFTS